MHGVTGRMGMNQHLIRSIVAIRAQGGVTLSNGDKVMPDPILIGRNAEKFKMAAKIEATNIPFKGSGEAVSEVLAGRVDYYFSPIAPVIGQIKEGQLLALAVGSPKRAAALPDVPTTTEAGVPGSEFNFWIGMMAPAKTPRDIVNRLHDEVVKALATPEVKERFLKLGADAWTLKPEQFDAYIKEEIGSNAQLVKAAGLSVQQ